MKTAIHPKYLDSVEIRCSCGNVILVGSTKDKMKTELCSKCHPYYTGQTKLVDTAGRVDKFKAQQKKAVEAEETLKRRVAEKAKKPEAYKEKEVAQEVIDRATGRLGGKWGAPLGESLSEEVAKEAAVETEKPVKKAAKKATAKKPAKK